MIICRSPRKNGNTMTLVNWVKTRAEVEIIDAAHLNYKTNGCVSCYKRQESDEFKCVIKDEASNAFEPYA